MSKEQEKETQQTEEETPQEEGAPQETPQEETPEEKSKELQSALAQKDHWRKKAEDLEAKLNSDKKEIKPESKEAPKEGKDEWQAKIEFLLQNKEKNYNEEEFDHISNIASQRGISLEEAAKQEDGYIQFKREKVEKEQAPEPSTNQSTGGGTKPYNEMSLDEKEKWFVERGFVKPLIPKKHS